MPDGGLDAALDELYGVDPSEFVGARKRLSGSLRAAGNKDAAKGLQAARRPSTSAWALNQVARHQPQVVESLLDASRALFAAQTRGSNKPDVLREAIRTHREAIDATADAALAVLGDRSNDKFRGEIVSGPGGKQVVIEDPSGNPVELFRPRVIQVSGPLRPIDEHEDHSTHPHRVGRRLDRRHDRERRSSSRFVVGCGPDAESHRDGELERVALSVSVTGPERHSLARPQRVGLARRWRRRTRLLRLRGPHRSRERDLSP